MKLLSHYLNKGVFFFLSWLKMHSPNILPLLAFWGSRERGGISSSSLRVAYGNVLACEYHVTLKRKKVENMSTSVVIILQLFSSISTNDRWSSHAKIHILRDTQTDSSNSILFPPTQESILDTSDQDWGYHWNTLESAVILLSVNHLQTLLFPN